MLWAIGKKKKQEHAHQCCWWQWWNTRRKASHMGDECMNWEQPYGSSIFLSIWWSVCRITTAHLTVVIVKFWSDDIFYKAFLSCIQTKRSFLLYQNIANDFKITRNTHIKAKHIKTTKHIISYGHKWPFLQKPSITEAREELQAKHVHLLHSVRATLEWSCFMT